MFSPADGAKLRAKIEIEDLFLFKILHWAKCTNTNRKLARSRLVATSVPNVVRSSGIILTLVFTALKGHFDVAQSATIVGTAAFAMSAFSAFKLKETFGTDLDFVETREGQMSVKISHANSEEIFTDIDER